MSLIRAQRLPEQILPKRPLKALCEDYVRGFCRAGSRCDRDHDIYRIWEENTAPWAAEELAGFDNVLSLEPRVIGDDKAVFEHDRPGHLSERGCRHDNDFVDIRNVRILPTADEIISRRRPYMPLQNDSVDYLDSAAARLIDKTFRQLRYDSVESLRDVCYHASQVLVGSIGSDIQQSQQKHHRQETPQGNRYTVFHDVEIEEFCTVENATFALRVSFACPTDFRRNKLSQSAVLENGMLAALIGLDNDGVSLSVTFLEVELRLSSDALALRTGNHFRAGAQLTLAQPENLDDVRRMMLYTTSILQGRFVLVSFPTALQAGFSFCLKRLQNLFTTLDLAFSDYMAQGLATPDSAVPAPAYVLDQNFKGFDLSSLRKENVQSSQLLLNPREDNVRHEFLSRLSHETTLDVAQAEALYDTLHRSLACTQGPPGTGKTYLGVCLAKAILATPVANARPILVVCKTNHALDSFLGDLIKEDIKIVRFGTRSNDESMKAHNIKAVVRKVSLTHSNRNSLSLEKARVECLQLEVWKMCEALNGLSDRKPSWDVLKEHLKTSHRSAFFQFTEAEARNIALAQIDLARKGHGFAFNCWSEGRDLGDLHTLFKEFELYLGINPDLKMQPMESANIERLMAEVIAEARSSSQNAGEQSLWTMSHAKRLTLVQEWMSDVEPLLLVEKTVELHRRAVLASDKRKALRNQVDSQVLESQQVLGMTTTACAMNYSLLKSIGPKVVICEEAAEVLEAHTLCTLLPSVEHAIFIGDPLQLRPQIEEQVLSVETETGAAYALDVSTMERMMFPRDPQTTPIPFSQLRVQRRMHPEISAIPRAMLYPDLLDHESTFTHPLVAGLNQRSFWFTHQSPEDGDHLQSRAIRSPSNTFEVEMVAGLVEYLVDSGAYKLGEIAVITPYKGQLGALHRRLSSTCSIYLSEDDRQRLNEAKPLWEPPIEHGSKMEIQMTDVLRIATIDSFQGEEAKVVVFSAVRSKAPGFLRTPNRINVGCSRARDGFYVFGNATLLSKVDAWRKVIDVFASQGRLGAALRLQCSRHPTHAQTIYVPEDFRHVRPCGMLCGQILECGHVCEERCHALELHERMQCQRPCERIHQKCGHSCNKRCGEACGRCEVVLPASKLPCGHSVTLLCYEVSEKHDVVCKAAIDQVNFVCGHKLVVTCNNRNARQICSEPCGTILPCGHVCSGACGVCLNAGAHATCKALCGGPRECGHQCVTRCHDGDCPPCRQACRRSCKHGSCSRKCNEVCEPCIRACSVGCDHGGTCDVACSLPCLRLPCNEPCPEVLACGHLCPSLCGEVCPLQCPECLEKQFPGDRLIGLPCGHYLSLKDADDKFGLSEVYDVDNDGSIRGFVPSPRAKLTVPACTTCGQSAIGVRRYAAIAKLGDLPDVLDRMMLKFGRKMRLFQHQMQTARQKLDEGAGAFSLFCSRIRPSPLAGGTNQSLIKDRGNAMRFVQDRISRYFDEVVHPVQEQLSKVMQVYHPDGLPSSPGWPFDLRLQYLLRDCRWTTLTEALRMAEFLETLVDPSEQLHVIARGLRTEVAAQVPLNLEGIASLLTECDKRELKTLEAELHILRLQFLILGRNAHLENLPEPEESMSRIALLVASFPQTCAKFGDCSNAIKKTLDGSSGDTHIHYLLKLRDHWNQWGLHEIGHLMSCSRSHIFSSSTFARGCPECGPESKPGLKTFDSLTGESADITVVGEESKNGATMANGEKIEGYEAPSKRGREKNEQTEKERNYRLHLLDDPKHLESVMRIGNSLIFKVLS